MELVSLSAALEREHREIDGGIEEFTAALESGTNNTAPLTRAIRGLRRHIYLEEEFLFPPLKEAGLMMPIMVMIREHGELWRVMDGLDEQLSGASVAKAGAAGAEAGAQASEARGDSNVILGACRDLLSLLDRHNSKEEPIIYPQADAKLSDAEGKRLGAFLQSGTMPQGWVCSAALQHRP